MEREVLPSTRIPLQRACEARCEKGIIGKGGKDRTKKIVSIQVHGPTESIRSLGETKEKKKLPTNGTQQGQYAILRLFLCGFGLEMECFVHGLHGHRQGQESGFNCSFDSK